MPKKRYRYNDWVQSSPDAFTEYDQLINQALRGESSEYVPVQTTPVSTYIRDPHAVKQAQDLISRGMVLTPYDDVNQRLYADQGGWEMAGRTLGNILSNTILNVVEQVGSAFDFLGGKPDYENAVTKWASSKKDAFGEVYRRDPNAVFDMGDISWWLNHGKDLVASVAAFGIMGAGVSTALSKGALGFSRFIQSMMSADKAAKYGSGINKALQGTSNLGSAAILAYAEGTLSGAQTYKKVYDREFQRTGDASYAEQVAAASAANTVKINTLLNTALNVTSLAPFFKHGADSDLRRRVSRQLFDRRNKSIRLDIDGAITPNNIPLDDNSMRRVVLQERDAYKKAIGKKTLSELEEEITASTGIKNAMKEYLKRTSKKASYESIQEAFEELNNIWAEKLGEEGKGLDYMFRSPGEAFAEYWELAKSEEGRLSMFLGAVGGAGQTSFIAAMPQVSLQKNEKTGRNRLHISAPKELQAIRDEISEFATTKKAIIDDINDLMAAEAMLNQGIKENNSAKIEEAKQQFFNIKARQTVRRGQTDLMIAMMEEIQGLDNSKPMDDSNSFSEAETLGFAENNRDNEYIATAQRQINILTQLDEAYRQTFDLVNQHDKENPGYSNYVLSTLTDFYSYQELANQKLSEAFKLLQLALNRLGGFHQLESFDSKGTPHPLKEVVDNLRKVLGDNINNQGVITLFTKDNNEAIQDAFDKLKRHKASGILQTPEVKAAFDKIAESLEFARKSRIGYESYKHAITAEGLKEYKENNSIEKYNKEIEDSIEQELISQGYLDEVFDEKFWYDLESETGITQEDAKNGEEFIIKIGDNIAKIKYEPKLDENGDKVYDNDGNLVVEPKIVSALITDEDLVPEFTTISHKSKGFFRAAKNDDVEYLTAEEFDRIKTEIVVNKELAEISELLAKNQKTLDEKLAEKEELLNKLKEINKEIKEAKKKFEANSKSKLTKAEFLKLHDDLRNRIRELRAAQRKLNKDIRLLEGAKDVLLDTQATLINELLFLKKAGTISSTLINKGNKLVERHNKVVELLQESQQFVIDTNNAIDILQNVKLKIDDAIMSLADLVIGVESVIDFTFYLKYLINFKSSALSGFNKLERNLIEAKLKAFEDAKNSGNANMTVLTLANLINTLSYYLAKKGQKEIDVLLRKQIELINNEFETIKDRFLKSLTPEERQALDNVIKEVEEANIINFLSTAIPFENTITQLENELQIAIDAIGDKKQMYAQAKKELDTFRDIFIYIQNLRHNLVEEKEKIIDEQSSEDDIDDVETTPEKLEEVFNDRSLNDYIFNTTGRDLFEDAEGNPVQNENFNELWYTYLDKNAGQIKTAIAQGKLKLQAFTTKNLPDDIRRIIESDTSNTSFRLQEDSIIVMPVYKYADGFYPVKVDSEGNFVSPSDGKEYSNATPVFNFLPLVESQLGESYEDYKKNPKVTNRAIIELFLQTEVGRENYLISEEDLKEITEKKLPIQNIAGEAEDYEVFMQKAYALVKSRFEKSLNNIKTQINEAAEGQAVLLDVVGLAKGHIKFKKGDVGYKKGEEVIKLFLPKDKPIVEGNTKNYRIVTKRDDAATKRTLNKTTFDIPSNVKGQPFLLVEGQSEAIPVETTLINDSEINTVLALIKAVVSNPSEKYLTFNTAITAEGKVKNINNKKLTLTPSKGVADTLLDTLISWNSKNEKYKIYFDFGRKKLVFTNPHTQSGMVSIPFSELATMTYDSTENKFVGSAQVNELIKFLKTKRINVKSKLLDSVDLFYAPSLDAEGNIVLREYKDYTTFLKDKLQMSNIFITPKGKSKHSRNLNLGISNEGYINTSIDTVNTGPKAKTRSSSASKTSYQKTRNPKQPFNKGEKVKIKVYNRKNKKFNYYTATVVFSNGYNTTVQFKKGNQLTVRNHNVFTNKYTYQADKTYQRWKKSTPKEKQAKERKSAIPFIKGTVFTYEGNTYRVVLTGTEGVTGVPVDFRKEGYVYKNLTEEEQQEVKNVSRYVKNDELIAAGLVPNNPKYDATKAEEVKKAKENKSTQENVQVISDEILPVDLLEQASNILLQELNLEDRIIVNALIKLSKIISKLNPKIDLNTDNLKEVRELFYAPVSEDDKNIGFLSSYDISYDKMVKKLEDNEAILKNLLNPINSNTNLNSLEAGLLLAFHINKINVNDNYIMLSILDKLDLKTQSSIETEEEISTEEQTFENPQSIINELLGASQNVDTSEEQSQKTDSKPAVSPSKPIITVKKSNIKITEDPDPDNLCPPF